MSKLNRSINVHVQSGGSAIVGADLNYLSIGDAFIPQEASILIGIDDENGFPLNNHEPEHAGNISFEICNLDTLDEVLDGSPLDIECLCDELGFPEYLLRTIELLLDPDKYQQICRTLGMKQIHQVVDIKLVMLTEEFRGNEIGAEAIKVLMKSIGSTSSLFMLGPVPVQLTSNFFDQLDDDMAKTMFDVFIGGLKHDGVAAIEHLAGHLRKHGYKTMYELAGTHVRHDEYPQCEVMYIPAVTKEQKQNKRAA